MQIRIANDTDIDAIFAIRTGVADNHLSLQALAELGITPQRLPAMLQGQGRGWVALEGQTPVAFAMADAQEASIFALFVLPAYEKQGLGRRLMHEAEQWLQAQGCAEVWLETDANPAVRAYGFYRHLGWQDAGRTPEGDVVLKKTLGPGVHA